jgi:hypothetical protein
MNRFFKVAALAGALLVAAGSVAMASTVSSEPGRQVAVTQELKDFFAANGADASYLGMAKSSVPAAEWAKIVAVVNTPDVTDDTTDTHDVLNSLVGKALGNATSTIDDPVYMNLGGEQWVYELVADDD